MTHIYFTMTQISDTIIKFYISPLDQNIRSCYYNFITLIPASKISAIVII